MKYKSAYFQFTLEDKLIIHRIMMVAVAFILPYALTAIAYSEPKTRGAFNKVFHGLGNMPLKTYLIILPIALIFSVVLLVLVNYKYNKRNIIVGVNPNEEKEILTVRTRTLSGAVCDTDIPYLNVRIFAEQLSDGWSSPMYNCYSLSNRSELIGHFYIDHEMWEKEDNNNLKALLYTLNRNRNVD